MIKNQKGFLTLDFIFASTIFYVFASVLFSFAITFSVVEVFQYISFSSARSYSLADTDIAEQEARARAKYQSLAFHPTMRPLLENNWFAVEDVQIGNFSNRGSEDDNTSDANTFHGVIIPFNAPILYKRVPLLGSTASNPDGFLADIQSFLGREPTQDECLIFNEDRYNNFIQQTYPASDADSYLNMADNGC